jgi:hypothetical protein
MPVAITVPLAFKSLTGKDASKYHVPRASPVIVKGLLIIALGRGEVTLTFADVNGVPVGLGVEVREVEGETEMLGLTEGETEGLAVAETDGDGVITISVSSFKIK